MPTFSSDPMERAEEERCVADVERYGLHVLKIAAEIDSPTFAYTVGLHHTFQHPEVIVLGLPLDTMHRLLNDLADRIRAGQRYAPNDVSSELLEDCDVTFRTVPVRHYRPYLGWANWFNDGVTYPGLQMIYPDRHRRWPWDAGVSDAFRQNQPVLESAPVPAWARGA
jgi:hypothetical protein